MARWREELHPRDSLGRFVSKHVGATLADIATASDDDLVDAFTQLSRGRKLDEVSLTRIADELGRRDDIRNGKLPPPDETPQSRQIDDLVSRGWSYADAYAEAYHVSARRIRSEQLSSLLGRRKGETLRQAKRRAYVELVALEALQAEEDTRGHMLSRECQGIDPESLWSAAPARARRCASEELKRWWEEHGGRRTFATFSDSLTGEHTGREAALAGAGRDFGL